MRNIYWGIIWVLLGMLLGAVTLNTAKAEEQNHPFPLNEVVQGFPILACDTVDSALLIAQTHANEGIDAARITAAMLGKMAGTNNPKQPECGLIESPVMMFLEVPWQASIMAGTVYVVKIVFPGVAHYFYAPMFLESNGA
jgi:hypothetical protein